MAGPIARRPSGLLDLLLTQQQGDNPDELGNLLVPTIDLRPFYQVDRLQTDSKSLTVSAVGSFANFTVPSSRAWFVYAVGVRGAFNATGQRVRLGGRISGVPGNAFVDFDSLDVTAVGATDTFGKNFVLPNGGNVIYPSGTSFTILAQQFTIAAGANLACNVQVMFVPLEV